MQQLQRMGRAGRKRQGKCFMLMTEIESKKFEQAKESYARVQRLITQGTYLSYYKPNPTVIPVNYKPTICRKELSIGRYEHTEVKKKRRTASSSVIPNVNPDGLMTATTERQFLLSLCDDLNFITNLSQAMGRYWPYKPMTESMRKVIPFQTKAKPIYRVGNSNRTTQFVHLIEKMENRILNPDEDTEPSLPTLTITKTQTTLKMPSKAGASSSSSSSSNTLKIPVRKKHKTQAEETDDAFADFMEQNDVSHFLNNASDDDNDGHVPSPEINPRRVILEDFFAPRKKGKAKAVQPKSPPPPPSSALSISAEDMSIDGLPSTRSNERSKTTEVSTPAFGDPPTYSEPRYRGDYKPPSSDSTHDVDMPDLPSTTTTKTSRHKGKEKMTTSQEMSLVLDDDFDSSITDNERTISDPILPKNLYEDVVPFENKPVSATELKLAKQKQQIQVDKSKSPEIEEEAMELDAGDNDFGESIFDDMILEAENKALANLSAKGFDDDLPPVFPFEKESQEAQTTTTTTNSITFIWTQSTPKFSDKALQLLEERQKSIKEMTGKFVAMNIIAKFKIPDQPATTIERKKPSPILISTQSPPKQALTFSQDFDDDFAFGSAFMEEAAAIEQNLQRNQETKEVAAVSKEHPIETNEEVPEDQAEEEEVQPEEEEARVEEEDFAGFSDIDFDELNFTNIIENKLSDDEPGYHHFMHVEENYNYASQQASQMKERQSLYSIAPKTVIANDTVKPPPNTPEREEIFEIDFSDTPTPPPTAAADEEVVYEYDFSNSSDDEKTATQSKAAGTPPPLSPASDKARLTSPPKVSHITDNGQVPVKSPVAERTQHLTPLRENSKDTVQYSPNKLLQMSKGLAPPLAFSPVNNSPLRNTFAEDSDDSLINMPVRQRKRRTIDFSPMDEDSEDEEEEQVRPSFTRRKKRLKRKSSTPLSTDEARSVILLSNDEEEEEDDDVVFAPPSRSTLLQRLQECKEDDPQRGAAKKHRKIIQTLDDLAENPFMDVEAEKSSDEGHTSEDEDGGSSNLNSFIDDDSLDPESHISMDDEVQDLDDGIQKKKKKVNIYMQSMMNDDAVAGNSKHWMNRFDANKWLNAGEDSIIEDDAESYGEEEEDPESVTEFSSHLQPLNEDPIFNLDDEDDDFM